MAYTWSEVKLFFYFIIIYLGNEQFNHNFV